MTRSVEDLLQIAMHDPKKEVAEDSESLNSVERFVLFFNIQEGDYPIKNQIIYNMYLEWCAEKPLTRIPFFQHLSKFFPKKTRTKKGRFYMLDPTPFPEDQLDYLIGRNSGESKKKEKESSSN